jgi:hypothetical protein
VERKKRGRELGGLGRSGLGLGATEGLVFTASNECRRSSKKKIGRWIMQVVLDRLSTRGHYQAYSFR